jgi:CheY-like chemotaxis protein
VARAAARILLVEDDEVTSLIASRALSSRGYCVRRAATGEEAVAACEAGGAFDLMLIDIDLGTGIDGVEAARSILAKEAVALVFYTSFEPAEVKARIAGIGRHGYVRKGADTGALFGAIALELEIREAESLVSRLEGSIGRIERLREAANADTDGRR